MQQETKNYYLIDPPEGWKYEFPKSIMEDEYSKKITDLKQWCIDEGYPKTLAYSYGNYFNIVVTGPIPCVVEELHKRKTINVD